MKLCFYNAEFAGYGPAAASYERQGVSIEGGLARSLAFSFGRG